MFSYRHAFHAGNHADVLKHITWIAILDHLIQKEAPLTVVDTHAGAGVYRLDGEVARTSAEAVEGVQRVWAAREGIDTAALAELKLGTQKPKGFASIDVLAHATQRYLDILAGFNDGKRLRAYPGSPFISQAVLRPQDRLKIFELHPVDGRTMQKQLDEHVGDVRMQLLCEDGFEGLKKLIPPPIGPGGSKRAVVLIDPSYEIKTDYAKVSATVAESLKRFATGCYVIWYPIIARPEAHSLPRKLKTLATQAGKTWLNATLNVGREDRLSQGEHPPLSASGMFVVNPPHSLKPALADALPQLKLLMAQGRGAGFTLDAGH